MPQVGEIPAKLPAFPLLPVARGNDSSKATSMRHFLDLLDCDGDDILKLLREAARLKKDREKGKEKPLLAGKVLGMVFEKPSLRTRVSFQAAMFQLGGAAVFLSAQDAPLGKRETIPDFARTMSQYVDAVVLRTFSHASVEDFARHASCPVINGLSDYYHPCQALGDLLTMQEAFGDLEGRKVVFVGDGNNVARSLAVACGKVGVRFVLSAPKGYGFDKAFLQTYRERITTEPIVEDPDPRRAAAGADVLYTDVWTSMGQEEQTQKRRKAFAPFQVNADLVRLAAPHCKVLHCLPAHRGEEITEEVLEGPHSVVFPQAGNRMHVQKALLVRLLR